MQYNLLAGNFLTVGQTAGTIPFQTAAFTSYVVFAQKVSINPKILNVRSGLVFHGQVDNGNVYPQSVSSHINFYHTATIPNTRGNCSNTAVFANTATVIKVHATSSIVVFAGLASCEVVVNRVASNDVSFVGGATCLKTNVINNRFIAIYIPPPSPNPGADDGHCP